MLKLFYKVINKIKIQDFLKIYNRMQYLTFLHVHHFMSQ